MALPVLEKIWQFDANRPATVGYAQLWWTYKDALISFALSPWTVVGSSNSLAASTTFPMDGVDRWLAPANVVIANPPAAHSWIVLEQPAIAPGFEICLEPAEGGGGNPNNLRLIVSPSAGFGSLAVGSTTARPTATDEVVIYNNATMGNANNVVGRPQILMSSDGQCTRMLGFSVGGCVLAIFLDVPKTPVPGWTIPWVAMHAISVAGTLDQTTYPLLTDLSTRVTGREGLTTMPFFCTTEGYLNSTLGELVTFPNDLDSNGWPMSPVGLVCTTAPVRGRHGQFFDLWFGSTAINTGDNYPDDASRQFVQFGDLILPWDGSIMQRT